MNRPLLLAAALAVVLPSLAGCLGGSASSWAYDMTGISALHDRGLTGRGVRVAIVDTGFNAGHPSLDQARVVAWKDYVGGRPDPYDDVGHGSHVAGIVVGRGGSLGARWQGYDLKGAAPDAELIIVKAISADGTGQGSAVADGIRFSTANQADVICLSLGARSSAFNQFVGDDITNAVNAALNQGILVVAAAGNTGQDSSRNDVESPATIDGVIAVGAVDQGKRVAEFSAHGSETANYGPFGNGLGATRADPNRKPELAAPGVDIKSAWKGKEYAVAKGTSQAAPFVCGALALLLEGKPALRSANSNALTSQVKTALMQSAEKVPSQRAPHDPEAGYGLLRADLLFGRF